MAEWIEVPAHRIYVICARELRDGFACIGENGKPVERGEITYRFVRKKDGKVFKWVAIIGSCAVIALLAEYIQQARSLEKVSHRIEAMTFMLK